MKKSDNYMKPILFFKKGYLKNWYEFSAKIHELSIKLKNEERKNKLLKLNGK